MLNPQDLSRVLGQANTDGVYSTVLVDTHGALVAFSGAEGTTAPVRDTIGLASSIWSAYVSNKHNSAHDDALQCLVMVCERGHMAVQRAGSSGLLLCMFAEKRVGLGILKAKTEAMAKYLKNSLVNIAIA